MSHPSRRAYADTGHATYDDYEYFSRRPLQSREHKTRHKVTVTRYRIDTSVESTTSYHDRREYSAYGSHPFSSRYQSIPNEGYRGPTPPTRGNSRMSKASFKDFGADYTNPDNLERESNGTGLQGDERHGQSDRHYSSDDYTMPEKRKPKGPQSPAEEQREYTSYARAKQSQQEELKPAQKGQYSGIPRSRGSNEHVRSDNHSLGKPNKSGSCCEENYHNSRSSTRRQEDSRGGRNGPHHEACEQSYYKPSPKPSQPKEPQPTPRDGHAREPKSDGNQRFATKDKPSQGKPESGGSRRQEKPHSSRSESRRGGIPRSSTKEPSNAIPQPEPEAKDEFPDFYAILEISHLATEVEIKRATRRRRVEVHPDKLKRPGMSDSERDKIDAGAAQVGQAADVPQNLEQKLEYDRKLYAAETWGEWQGK